MADTMAEEGGSRRSSQFYAHSANAASGTAFRVLCEEGDIGNLKRQWGGIHL